MVGTQHAHHSASPLQGEQAGLMDQALIQLLTFLTGAIAVYSWWQMLIFFVLVLLFVMAINYKKTKPVWEWLGKLFAGRRLKRSCKDCMTMLVNMRERANFERDKLSSNILKGQMVFAEQKIGEVEMLAIREFDVLWAANKSRLGGVDDVVGELLKQQRLFICVLRETLAIIRDEVRRSYKENGFCDLDEKGMQAYVRNRNKVIQTIMFEHFRSVYPPAETMVVHPDELVTVFNKISQPVSEIINEMYLQAADHRRSIQAKINKIDSAFQAELSAMMSDKN
jgi:hypothetical protein